MTRRRILLAMAALASGPVPGRAAATRRIVSIGGAVTETLFALGAGTELVGADTTSLYPPAARLLPSVGYARTLSPEGVLSLRPTLIIAGAEAGPPAVVSQIRGARIALLSVDTGFTADGVVEMIRRIGVAVDRVPVADPLAARLSIAMGQALQRVEEIRGGRPRPRVLFLLSQSVSQIRIAGRETAADAIIRLAGGENAFGVVQGYRPLTPEAAVASAPDVILCTDQGLAASGGIHALLRAPGLGATPAGRGRRVVHLDALFMLGFGPRLPSAVTSLSTRLYGGAT